MTSQTWSLKSAESPAQWSAWLLLAIAAAATLFIWIPASWFGLALQIALIAALAYGLASLSGSGQNLKPALPLLAMAGVGVFQLVANSTENHAETSAEIVLWLSLSAVAYLCSMQGYNAPRLLSSAADFAGIICILALAQFFTSRGSIFWLWPTGEPSVLGPFQSRNNFASFALLFLPWHVEAARKGSLKSALFSAAATAALIASGSRAGAILALFEIAAVLVTHRNRRSLAVAALLGSAAAIGGWDILERKLQEKDPMLFRREMMLSTVDLIAIRPIAGYGLGALPHVYPSQARFDSGYRVNHSHNDWLEWCAEAGIPIALSLALALAWAIRQSSMAWALGLAAVALHALVDYPFQRFGLAIWIVFVATLAPKTKI